MNLLIDNILTIIPARGGSKGVPRKNIRKLGGKPLIAYTIESAHKSKYVDKIFVSTEDEEIAKIARNLGAEIPFIRPKELASDTAKSVDVIKHAIVELEKIMKIKYDIIVLLEPPAPFRTGSDIDECVELFLQNKPGSVVSVCEEKKYHPHYLKKINNGFLEPYGKNNFPEGTPRQLLTPKIYMINGCVYVIRRDNVMQGNIYGEKVIPFIMPNEKSINIDTMLDWYAAEASITFGEN